jgi:transcriptional regulatory protein LevR
LILQIDRGGGVLLLVDMGSIGMLGEVISNETKIKIKIIEMATTVLGIECARKAMAERNIDVIWNEVVNSNNNFVNYSSSIFRVMEPGQENVILTVCVTGEGSAVKLKHLIEENIPLEEKNIHIIPMSISGKNEIEMQIEKLAKSKNILGIVGTINPEIHGIPFISATETILDKNYSKIRQFINLSAEKIAADEKARQRQRLNEVIDSLANEIKSFDASAAKPFLIGLINTLNENFDNSLSFDAAVGLLFHICSAAEKSLNQEPSSRFKYTKQIMKNYSREISVIGKCLEPLEAQLNIKFSEDERCAILYFLEGFQIEELQE